MKKRRVLQDITPQFKKINKHKLAHAGIITVFVLGLLIITLANLIDIYSESKDVTTRLSKTSYANYETLLEEVKNLHSLSKSSIELQGDLLQGGRYLLDAVNHVGNIIESLKLLDVKSLEDISLIIEHRKQVVTDTSDELKQAEEKLLLAEKSVLQEGLKERLPEIKSKLAEISDFVEKSSTNIPALEKLLGIHHPHRYLILFQNNQESRPTGGFIGSLLLLDINDGEITKTDVMDVYDLDGQYHEHIEPPAEIRELTPEWRLRDSNYWPDFSVSGEKAAWFFQKEGGPSVDTVIAINQSILKELLKITGPMRIEGLRGEFTDENYDVILSYIIESKLTGKNTPKQVLKNLVPAVKEEIIKPENFVKVFQLLKNEIARKNLLAYSRHDDVEEYFDQIKASGKMIKPAANEDYLSVVTTSISGNKSDKYIEQSIDHNTWISKDGEIINQVAVTRRHTWDTNELWKWWDYLSGFGYTYISDAIKDILGRGKNTSVIRVYVPTGSILQETTSIANVERAFDNGLEKEFFVFRMEVAPGEEKKVVIDYKLPFKLNFSPFAQYKFHVQKQPGNLNTLFRKKVSGERITLQSAFPESMTQEDELMYKLKLDYDEYFASLWGK